MIKTNIYKDFREHTGLSDVVYETIFEKIEENLYRVNDVAWLYFTYSDKESKTSSTTNFSKDTTIPLYVVELIKNAFGNYYTLPKSVVVTIGLSYKNKDYMIICNSEETSIPDEIFFIKEYFILFFMTHPVRDVFEEYESIFSFIGKFKTSVKKVFPALEKKFEMDSSQTEFSFQNISQKEIVSEKLLIDSLEEKMNQTLTKIEHIKTERENLKNEKEAVLNSVNNRDSFLQERSKLAIEYQMLNESLISYEERLNSLNTIIKEIDSELSFIVDRGGVESDKVYLQDKKIIFEHDKSSVEKTFKDISILAKDTKTNLEILNTEIRKIETYKDTDISGIEKRINELNSDQDNLFKELLGYETKLKSSKSQSLDKQLKFEQSQTYVDSTINNIESSSIINHLSASLQPFPVNVISNYLRYYFGYYTTLVSSNLLKKFPNDNIYAVQALATRIVLVEYFGLIFNNFFSVFPIENSKIKNVLLIIKEN